MGSAARYRALKGMPDVLPDEAFRRQRIDRKAREIFDLFGYREIRTPILEETEVFTRSIGADTDIVEKEMYTFEDRGGKSVSMRPEGTAPIIRSYIEHGWHNSPDIVKLFYSGPMFRGERPQKGRLRQFHQIGAEMIGGSDPLIDAELISTLHMLFTCLGLEGFSIVLNSLGCAEDRKIYKKRLAGYLRNRKKDLCDNCVRRAGSNVLRVLDCKNPGCREVVSGAPSIRKSLCDDCSAFYERLKSLLNDTDISFTEKGDLVRGLDYYTGTIFEVVHQGLGAQDALAAGGRYDDLSAEMGGSPRGATGYAIGVERLLLALGDEAFGKKEAPALVIPMDADLKREAFSTVCFLRDRGISCDMDLAGRSFKAQLRKANREDRRFVLIIGEDEVREGMVTLKDMSEGTQTMMEREKAVEALRKTSGLS
ncbi:MAG: histidine--tRNA ligase [Candidatus Omnitrophica bacterium]|nr:histidine--tRNA ligase [Candidatus Omnitrophota bacterium]